MDVAASEFYTGKEDNRYDLDFKNKNGADDQKVSATALTDLYAVRDVVIMGTRSDILLSIAVF